jgi:hypothetical protein
MARKAHPERVNSDLARQAIAAAHGDRQAAYTHYIVLHFNATKQLAPDCDAADLWAWLAAAPAADLGGASSALAGNSCKLRLKEY